MTPDLAPLVEAARVELERQGFYVDGPDWCAKVHFRGEEGVQINLATLVEAVLAAQWRPIETAPKDGTVIEVFCREPVDVERQVYCWPEDAQLHSFPARWHEPNRRTHDEAGWYAPWFNLEFGPWDDPSTDIESIRVEPSHWRPLTQPKEPPTPA